MKEAKIVYEIIYDYLDDAGNENRNIVETFEGDWTELQTHLKKMRKNGCYNITATALRED